MNYKPELPLDQVNREIRNIRAAGRRIEKKGGLWLSARLGYLEYQRSLHKLLKELKSKASK